MEWTLSHFADARASIDMIASVSQLFGGSGRSNVRVKVWLDVSSWPLPACRRSATRDPLRPDALLGGLTCRACNVEPYAYLVHVLTELPQRAPDADVTDLLPFNFAKLTAPARTPA
jgi:hypothetical protein